MNSEPAIGGRRIYLRNLIGLFALMYKIKGLLRSKKIKLIESMNPGWKDIAEKYELMNKELIYVTLRAKK